MWIYTNKNVIVYYDDFNITYLNSIIGCILKKQWTKEQIKFTKLNSINYSYINEKIENTTFVNDHRTQFEILNKKCNLLEKIHYQVEEARKPYEKKLYNQDKVYEIKYIEALKFINSNFDEHLLDSMHFLKDEIYIQNTSSRITALGIQRIYHEHINILRFSERTRRLFNERVLLSQNLRELGLLEQIINDLKNYQIEIQ